MNLATLPKLVEKGSKRVGRGNGSGKGKTAGRGQKGQKARGTIRVDFEGGQLRIIKRLPFKRGVGNKKAKPTQEVKIGDLNELKSGSVVNEKTLVEAGIVAKNSHNIKIIGGGSVTVPLTVEVSVTASVKEMIEKAGGKVS